MYRAELLGKIFDGKDGSFLAGLYVGLGCRGRDIASRISRGSFGGNGGVTVGGYIERGPDGLPTWYAGGESGLEGAEEGLSFEAEDLSGK